MSSRKRGAAEAGIKIHVKKGFEDDPDAEEMVEEEDAPSKQQPSQEQSSQQVPLQKRKAIRRLAHGTPGQEEAPTKNLFAGIGSQFGQPNFSASAFSGAGASSSASNGSSAQLSSTSLFPTSTSASAESKSIFSSATAPSSASLFAISTTPAQPSIAIQSVPKPLASSNDVQMTVPRVQPAASSSVSGPANGLVDDNKLRTIAALNTSFLTWLESKVKSTPEASLVSGVRMYIEHAASIVGSSSNGSEALGSGSSTTKPAASDGNSLFGGLSAPTTTITTGNSATSSSLFAKSNTESASALLGAKVSGSGGAMPPFGVSSTGTSSMFGSSNGASLASAAPSSSLFGSSAPSTLFGSGTSNVAGGSTSLFGSGGAAPSLFGTSAPGTTTSLFGTSAPGATTSLFSAPASGGGLFGSNGAAPSNAGEDGEGDDGADDDGDAEPAEPTIQAVKYKSEEEDTLFELEPCKVLVLKENEWLSRGGKGHLVVTKHKQSGKHRVMLRAGTTGNLYFNAPLNNTMLSSLARQKNAVRLLTTSFTTDESGQIKPDNDGKPTFYTIKTLTEDDAERLRGALERAMKSS